MAPLKYTDEKYDPDDFCLEDNRRRRDKITRERWSLGWDRDGIERQRN